MAFTANRTAAFERYVKKLMKEYKAPGYSIVIADGEDMVYAKGFGYRNLKDKAPVTVDTIFGIASVTKTFTAIAIAQLVAANKLSYQDPVSKYLPNFSLQNGRGGEVTLHHLLIHTSSLPPLPALGTSMQDNSPSDPPLGTTEDEPGSKKKSKRQSAPINNYEQLLKFISSYNGPFFGCPGQYFSYSNDGYALLGAIIKEVSGQTYAEYVKDHILRPLDMRRTMFSFEEMLEYGDVTDLYYNTEKDEFRHSTRWQAAPPYLAGGWLKSSAKDLIRMPQLLAQKGVLQGVHLLPEDSVLAKMTSRHQFSLLDSYAYGFRVRPNYHGVTLVEHGGALKGVSSTAGFVPERGLSAVVLCNMSGAPAFKVWLAAINLGLGLPIDTPRHVYETRSWEAQEMGQFTGRYRSGEGATFDIVIAGRELEIRFKHDTCLVKAINSNTGLFTLKGQEMELLFYTDEQSQVFGVGMGVRIIPRIGDLPRRRKP